MDLRIVNICNSDCVYCLEQWLRKKKKFLEKKEIFSILTLEKNRNILSFYWWNPLLHPDLLDIICFAKNLWYKNISLLTNTIWLSNKLVLDLKLAGLTGISFYFHSFLKEKHDLVVRGGIQLDDLIRNIYIIKNSNLRYKCIIHVNKQNIKSLYKDTAYLFKKFAITDFEFIKYHLVSRAKKDFKYILEYKLEEEKKYLSYLKKIIFRLNITATFVKF